MLKSTDSYSLIEKKVVPNTKAGPAECAPWEVGTTSSNGDRGIRARVKGIRPATQSRHPKMSGNSLPASEGIDSYKNFFAADSEACPENLHTTERSRRTCTLYIGRPAIPFSNPIQKSNSEPFCVTISASEINLVTNKGSKRRTRPAAQFTETMASTLQCTPHLVGREAGCSFGGKLITPKSNSSLHCPGSISFEKAVLSGREERGAAAAAREPVAVLRSLSKSSLFGDCVDSHRRRRREVLPCSNWECGKFSRAPGVQAVQAIPGNVE